LHQQYTSGISLFFNLTPRITNQKIINARFRIVAKAPEAIGEKCSRQVFNSYVENDSIDYTGEDWVAVKGQVLSS